MSRSPQLETIVDKLGFLKYETEQWYCKKNGLPFNYFLDWSTKEEQYWMRLFQHSPQGQAWLSDPSNKEYIEKYCDNLESIYQ